VTLSNGLNMNRINQKSAGGRVKFTVYLNPEQHKDIIAGIVAMSESHVISYYIARALREKLRRDKYISRSNAT
jgi:hypothetical protein